MPLHKSEKAKQELASKSRTLSVRERSALFLADGVRTRDQLVWLLQGDGTILQKLMAEGYLVSADELASSSSRPAAAAPAASGDDWASRSGSQTTSSWANKSGPMAQSGADWAGKSAVSRPAPLNSGFSPLNTQSGALETVAPPPPPSVSADNFEGKRSMATTRMFLFDICERMFVRKMPDLANKFREQLRYARDREAMMVIAREIITHVEEIAGPERADSLSERIAMLLPPE